jgi:hypothetical protein
MADGAVDIDGVTARAADQMVVVVTHPVLVAGWRSGRLDPAKETLVDQDAEGVVHALAGNGADLGADPFGNVVSGSVRKIRNRPQNCQALSRDL